jgi:hypothetical protein
MMIASKAREMTLGETHGKNSWCKMIPATDNSAGPASN